MRWSTYLLFVLALVVAFLPASSSAQTGGELAARGAAAYEEGELERSRELFEQAFRADALSREEVVQILSHQVLLAQALGDGLDTAALRLLTLEPEGLGESTSPQLAAVFERLLAQTHGEVVRVELEHHQSAGSTTLRAHVRGDVGGLVQSVRLWARTRDTPFAEQPTEGTITLGASPDDIEVVAEAVGPGGSLLASHGSPSEPRRLVSEVIATEVAESDDTGFIVGVSLGIVGVLAAAAAIVAIVLVTSADPENDVMGPVVEW